MLSFLNPYALAIKIAVLVALCAGSAWAGHQVTHNAWEAAQAEALAKAVTDYKAAEAEQNKAVANLAVKQEKTRVIYRTINKAVEKSAAGLGARECLDAGGLSAANAALARQPASVAEPATAVPAPVAP